MGRHSKKLQVKGARIFSNESSRLLREAMTKDESRFGGTQMDFLRSRQVLDKICLQDAERRLSPGRGGVVSRIVTQ